MEAELLIAVLVGAIFIPLYAVASAVFWRNVGLSQPWKAIFSLTVSPLFLLAMVANIWLTDRFAPGLFQAFAQSRTGDETLLGFFISVPIAAAAALAWYYVMRFFHRLTHPTKPKVKIVDTARPRINRQIIGVIRASIIPAIAFLLCVFGVHYFLDTGIVFSLLAGVVVFVGGKFLFSIPLDILYGRRRRTADPVFQSFVGNMRSALAAEESHISEVKGTWSFGYPSLELLFDTEDAIRRAEEDGLLDRLASELADLVRTDPVFAWLKKSFKKEICVKATADIDLWHFQHQESPVLRSH